MQQPSFRNILWLVLTVGTLLACEQRDSQVTQFDGVVKVGLLHSRTGTLAISEQTVAEAELLAIAEINLAGGLRIGGQRLEIISVEEDGQSDAPVFAHQAEKLINFENVAVIFGGWTSASRKAMLPVVEANDHLLIYPVQYEGEECSRNIFYMGAAPNQQAEPAVQWLLEHRGKVIYLLGSDYVYPRTTNRIIRAQAQALGGEVVGELYLPLGATEMDFAIQDILQKIPDGGIIINTINGDSNLAFFTAANAAGITAAHGYSIMSFSLAEEEVSAIGPEYLRGSLATWNYFQSLDTESSRTFTERFRSMHGIHRVTADPAEAAYSMVHLWALAAEAAGSVAPEKVIEHLPGKRFEAPSGQVTVQPNHHLEKRVMVGEVQIDGQFQILHDFGFIKPRAWSQWLPENQGYRCDWVRDPDDGSRIRAAPAPDEMSGP